jgi:hypothetical protein
MQVKRNWKRSRNSSTSLKKTSKFINWFRLYLTGGYLSFDAYGPVLIQFLHGPPA